MFCEIERKGKTKNRKRIKQSKGTFQLGVDIGHAFGPEKLLIWTLFT